MTAPNLITFRGETHSVSAWARILGMSEHGLADRFRNGWDIETALTLPSGSRVECQCEICGETFQARQHTCRVCQKSECRREFKNRDDRRRYAELMKAGRRLACAERRV